VLKVRSSEDRMPIEALPQQQSWVRGKRAFLSSPSLAGGGEKGLSSPHPALLLFEWLNWYQILT